MRNNNVTILYGIFIIAIMTIPLSCDKGFEELNKDPNKTTEVIPEYLFTEAQLSAISLASQSNGCDYIISMWMQQEANTVLVIGAGDKYIGNEGGSNYFSSAYPGPVNEIETLIRELSGPDDINKLSITRIWRVWLYQRITDLFGDIPYSEAAKGPVEQLYTPKYDTQSFIYNDMLKELEEASNSFDSSMPTFDNNSDLIYNGDIDKWKKFAYSMMLRLGMRLTEIDDAAAKTWVQKAIAGGVIVDDDDVAFVQYPGGTALTRNPKATMLRINNYDNQQDPYNSWGGKLSHKLINHLQVTKDPRLNIISVVMVLQPTGVYFADTTAALQKGLLNGAFDSTPDDFVTYSEPNPNTLLKYDSPILVLTNYDMNLNLAEAALRGWYSGSVEMAYNNAVKGAMKQWALWGSYGVIPDNKISSYLTYNPFKSDGSFDEKLEQIQTQRWVSGMFTDNFEIFANWRRTGYPKLQPVNYPGNFTGGTIPRRFIVPRGEELVNGANFLEAVARQGGNNDWTARVWWDKP